MATDRTAVTDRLADFLRRIQTDYQTFIGFPAATDFNYEELYPFFGYMLNNVGDPYKAPLHANHTKELEQEVITFFADLFRAPTDDRWGYVNNGGTEGNLYAMYIARELYPDARIYYSTAAHYSHPKNAHILRLPHQAVATQSGGEMDYAALREALQKHSDQPAIIIATIGTTMTEARDNVATIKQVATDAGIKQVFIHSDAALAGAYAPYLTPRHSFDFADGADSVSVSGHKFIGSPMACGVVIVRKSDRDHIVRSGAYTGTPDTTLSGSRNAHTPLILWYAIQRWGHEGFRQRALDGIQLAEYTATQLRQLGWNAWRFPAALTVMLPAPPEEIIHKWQLATYERWSHVICMPGVTKERIDAFLTDIAAIKPPTISTTG